MIYLHHPVHGVKVAYLEYEILDDKKNGWTEMDGKVQVESNGVSLRDLYTQRFGKPPHHRMKSETIAKKLMDNTKGQQ